MQPSIKEVLPKPFSARGNLNINLKNTLNFQRKIEFRLLVGSLYLFWKKPKYLFGGRLSAQKTEESKALNENKTIENYLWIIQHKQTLWTNRERQCCEFISRVTPLNAGELKV